MKTHTLACLWLAIALSAVCAAAPIAAHAGQAKQKVVKDQTQAQQKVIKDPTEYNAYISALNLTDPAQKAAAMEAFVKSYPKSVVLTDALEQAMAAYQQQGIAAQVENIANRLIVIAPNNVRALAILTYLERSRANNGDAAALAAMRKHAEQGLRALPGFQPNGMDDATAQGVRAQMSAILYGASGFGLLNKKDYRGAREAYLKAVAADASDMQNIYQLGLAEVEMNPIMVDGFWHLAKAMNMAAASNNAAGQQSIANYAKAKYVHYHGGEDGWDAIVAAAATQTAPPPGFATSIKHAPTPAEIAVQAVHDNDPGTLSFSDWEFVLGLRDASPANKEAAGKVWAAIQSKEQNGKVKLKIPVTVVSATPTTIEASITDDNIAAKTADIHIVMANPMAQPPSPGATIAVTGVITGYQPKPFKFTMTKGEL